MTKKRNTEILAKFNSASSRAKSGKISRWFSRPFTHLNGFMLSYGLHRITKRTYVRNCTIFTGDTMQVPLPAGLDLYLIGVKSHDSELRLARYLLNNVKSNSTVFDIGAHIGYFSVVCSNLAAEGIVYAFEPSPFTYGNLSKNLQPFHNCHALNMAVSDSSGTVTFYQLPQLYSEFDTFEEDSLSPELRSQAAEHVVQTTSIDDYCAECNCVPDIIKVDVEGAESSVLTGAMKTLKTHGPIVVIEVRKDNFDSLYSGIIQLVDELEYKFSRITSTGTTQDITDLSDYMDNLEMESDNVVLLPDL